MRGVSPAIGFALLLAISVMAVLGLWFWVTVYGEKPLPVSSRMPVSVYAFNASRFVVTNLGASRASEDLTFLDTSAGQCTFLEVTRLSGGIPYCCDLPGPASGSVVFYDTKHTQSASVEVT